GGSVVARRIAVWNNDSHRAVPWLHARSSDPILVLVVRSAHCRRGDRQVAGADQDAQGGRAGPAAIDATAEHRGFRHRGAFCDRLFPALSANTHIESICCLSAGVWYADSRLVVSPGGSVIA